MPKRPRCSFGAEMAQRDTILREERKRDEAERVWYRLDLQLRVPGVVNIVMDYIGKMHCEMFWEMQGRAKFWATQLRLNYRDMGLKVRSPKFELFDLFELYEPEYRKFVLPIIRNLDWWKLSYWELRKLLST